MPKWAEIGHSVPSKAKNTPLPPHVREILGKEGEALLDAMLAHEPAERIQPEHALQHPYLCKALTRGTGTSSPPSADPSSSQPGAPSSCQLAGNRTDMQAGYQPDAALKLWKDRAGNTSFCGERAPWKLLHGSIQPDVLEYLRGDSYFKTEAAEIKAQELHSFDEPQQKQNKEVSCRQKSCKIIISGGFGDSCSKSLNGLRIDKQFPVKRMGEWRDAFIHVNAAAFTQLDKNIKRDLNKLPPEELKQNGKHALQQPWQTWGLTGANLFLTQAHGELLEDAHVDGGAGMLLIAITLFGKRLLHCWKSSEKPSGASAGSQPEKEHTMQIPQEPGTVWLTCASSFRHQAEHQPSDDLMTFGDLKELSVAVIIRSSLFPFNRARLAARTPDPQIVFKTIAEAVATWQGEHTLWLPTLQQITPSRFLETLRHPPSSPKGRQPAKRKPASIAGTKKKKRAD